MTLYFMDTKKTAESEDQDSAKQENYVIVLFRAVGSPRPSHFFYFYYF